MSTKKKGSIINTLTFGRRTKASSTVEVDIGGPPVAERVSLSTGRGDVLTLVPAVLRTGLVEVRKIESGKWKRYKGALRTTMLCFYKEDSDMDGQAVMAFELLKLMVKMTVEDDLRMFYSGEWFEVKPLDDDKAESRAWLDAIQLQRGILYDQKNEAISPRKASMSDNAADLEKAVLSDARSKMLASRAQRGGMGDVFANVTGDVKQVRVDTLSKRIEVLSLEFHRSELECDVLSNNLKEYSSDAGTLMEKYNHLIQERARLSEALKGSWEREEEQQKAQGMGSATLSGALSQISQQVLRLQGGSLSVAIQELQREKLTLKPDVDDARLAQLNRAVSRLRNILSSASPCFAQETLLQRRVFELQFVVDQLENNNKVLSELVETQASFELELFGMELDEPARVATKVLDSWQQIADLPGDAVRVWMTSEEGPNTPPVGAPASHYESVSPGRRAPGMSAVPSRPTPSNPTPLAGSPDDHPSQLRPAGKVKLKQQVFLESLNETEQLIRQVDAKVSLLRGRVDDLSKVKQPDSRDLAASSLSVSQALSSLAGGNGSTRMTRSATVGDMATGSFGANGAAPAINDVEYEKLDSFSIKPAIKSAMTDRLIAFMITQEVDPELRRAVLLTYRLYLSPADLMGRLMLHYTRTPDYDSEKMYLKMFALLEPIRTGVVETVAMWARLHPHDFAATTVQTLLQKFVRLLRETRVDEKVIEGFNTLAAVPQPTPRALAETTVDFQGSMMTLLNIPTEQVAAQMTLLEFEHYRHIQATELHKISKGFGNSPNIQLATNFFNRACQFLISQILREKTYDVDAVATSIASVIAIGHHCKAFHNFDGVMICVAALNTSSISRLSDAWALLSREEQKRMDELNEMTKKNFKMLRDSMMHAPSPSIPHMALFVRDLTSLDESPTYIVSNGHVNYYKIRTMAQIIWQVLRHRDTPYQMTPTKRLQDWIMCAECLSEDEAYERSKLYKPIASAGGSGGVTGAAPSLAHSQTLGFGGVRGKKTVRKSLVL